MIISGRYVLLVLISFFLINCRETRITDREGLISYIQDPSNELVKTKELNGIVVKLSYMPSSLLMLQEMDGVDKKDKDALKALTAKYKNHHYFTLKISKNNKEVIRELGDFNSYSGMLQVLAFEMRNYIDLTTRGNDTIPVADYFLEQTYGISNGNRLLLSFNKEKIDKSDRIIIHLKEFGLGLGNVRFDFDVEDMKEVPDLDYNSQ